VTIRVFIRYETVPGNESSLYQLLMENRTRLLRIKGYISGETLPALDAPSSFLIISTWKSIDEWNVWVQLQRAQGDTAQDQATPRNLSRRSTSEAGCRCVAPSPPGCSAPPRRPWDPPA
jgi:heme-degrading monooxygenase HmoA